MHLQHPVLTRQQRAGRSFVIGGLIVVLLVLRMVDPQMAKWLPFPTSRSAITGVPCIFCGMSRALHLLLNGQFSRALYFNWLAFPFLAMVGLVIALLAIEIVQRRRILNINILPATPQRLTIIGLSVVVLWMLQVFLAVSQHKQELLNPRGPLYALFVRK
jgi:hypothetical protein